MIGSRFKNRHAARVHFVGIGGIGMSGIAEVLVNLGYSVSGSDLKESDVTRRLASLGAKIATGHREENVTDVDVVVISSAVKKDNPEVVAAKRKKIPVIPRAEMLAELMRLKYAVAIAGSHGKTTTTSMVATVLNAAGLDPTAVVGGKVNVLGSNAKLGKSELMVVEADESDGSFLHLHPSIAVVTNIDPEHMDHYQTLDALKGAFVEFCNRVPFYGLNVLCLDHPNVQALLPHIEKRFVTYGSSHAADYRLEGITLDGFKTRFRAFRRDEDLGEFTVPHGLRARGERLAHLRAVVRDQGKGRGEVLQLLHSELLTELPQRLPLADAGDAGVGEGVADALGGPAVRHLRRGHRKNK